MTILDFNNARRQGEAARQGIDLEDIRARLHDNPKAFIDWLYSGRAYYTRHEARIGNVDGEQGSSLSIDLRSGLWKDHATNDAGDLIALYRAWAGHTSDSTFVQSLKEIARDYLGDTSIELERATWAQSPIERIQKQKAKYGDKPRPENIELGAPVAEWRYYDLHGKIVASVKRYEPDGTPASKQYRPYCFKVVDGVEKWTAGAPDSNRPLYNLPEIALSSTVVLVEGEKCADALRSIGIPATTTMQGANGWEKTDFTPLAGKKVIIWPDKDDPGFAYAKNVASKLQALGCTVLGVTPPSEAREKWDAADCVAEGGDAHSIIAGATPVGDDGKARGKITSLDIDELENMKPPIFLVEGILTENGLSMFWGPSGALKSFVGVDVGLCVATGLAWHGKAVKQGLVFYVAAEGAHGLAKRIVGWRKTRGRDCPKPDFRLIPQPVSLAQEIDDLLLHILSFERKPKLIILDTVARTFGAGDENKQQDMNAYVAALDRLRLATGATVLVIHHSGVHDAKRERGSNVLRGAADTIIRVSRKGNKIDLINKSPEGKQKDFEEFATIKLEAVSTAFPQADGTEASTIILRERDDKDELEDEGDEGEGSGAGNAPRGGAVQDKLYEEIKKANGRAMDKVELCTRSGVKKGSFRKAITALVAAGLVDQSRDITTNAFVWRMAGT